MIRDRFGSLYSSIELDGWDYNIHYVSLFLIRRALFAVVIAYLRNYLFLQLELLMLSSMICLGFLIIATPYETSLNNALEFMNEILVITTIYILHTFSLVSKGSQKFKVGWIYLALIAIVILVNLTANLVNVVRSCIQRLKYMMIKLKHPTPQPIPFRERRKISVIHVDEEKAKSKLEVINEVLEEADL